MSPGKARKSCLAAPTISIRAACRKGVVGLPERCPNCSSANRRCSPTCSFGQECWFRARPYGSGSGLSDFARSIQMITGWVSRACGEELIRCELGLDRSRGWRRCRASEQWTGPFGDFPPRLLPGCEARTRDGAENCPGPSPTQTWSGYRQRKDRDERDPCDRYSAARALRWQR